MTPTPQQRRPSGPHAPVADEATMDGLIVEGVVPPGLFGRYVRIGPNPIGSAAGSVDDGRVTDGMVHAVSLCQGHQSTYRSRWIATDATSAKLGQEPVPGPPALAHDEVATNLVRFGGRVLALGDGALAYELTSDLDTVRRVDLAGGGRGVGAHPKREPTTGALHLVSSPGEPTAARHTISAGGLTRTTGTLTDAPVGVHDVAFTRDRWVALGAGAIGVAGRTPDQPFTWVAATCTAADRIVNAYDAEGSVVVDVADAALQRWTVDVGPGRADHEVIDASSGVARFNQALAGTRHRYVYVLADGAADGNGRPSAVDKIDLRRRTRERHDFGPGREPGEFVFVPDPARRRHEDGGWLVGFVHGIAGGVRPTDLVVLDAADLSAPPIAAVHIPRRIPLGRHGLWLPNRK